MKDIMSVLSVIWAIFGVYLLINSLDVLGAMCITISVVLAVGSAIISEINKLNR